MEKERIVVKYDVKVPENIDECVRLRCEECIHYHDRTKPIDEWRINCVCIPRPDALSVPKDEKTGDKGVSDTTKCPTCNGMRGKRESWGFVDCTDCNGTGTNTGRIRAKSQASLFKGGVRLPSDSEGRRVTLNRRD